jgi:hypothetical protein
VGNGAPVGTHLFYQYSFHCAVPKEGNGSPKNASSEIALY